MTDRSPPGIVREVLTGVRTAATYDALRSLPVPAGQRWHITQLAAYDATSYVALIVVWTGSPAAQFPVWSVMQDDITAPRVRAVDFWMLPGDRLFFHFYDGAAADLLNAYYYGTEETSGGPG